MNKTCYAFSRIHSLLLLMLTKADARNTNCIKNNVRKYYISNESKNAHVDEKNEAHAVIYIKIRA